MGASAAWRPVFIGGLRSGTTITCMLVCAHPLYAEVPELQFHSHYGGLAHLLSGRTTMQRFLERMEGWYYRSPPAPRPPGIHDVVPRRRFDQILDAFASSFASAPRQASRALILALVEPRLQATGKPTWAEATPTTTRVASHLHELVPEARFVHMVRDGRDCVASLRRLEWGSPDLLVAIRRWGEQVRLCDRERRRIPTDRFCAIELEALVRDSRERSYRRLLDFLGVGDDPAMRAFFEGQLIGERAHIGGWREELSAGEAEQLETAYASVLDGLWRDNVCLAPGRVEATWPSPSAQ